MTLPEKTEPSVLDYLKGKLFPGRNPEVTIPEPVPVIEEPSDVDIEKTEQNKTGKKEIRYIWAFLAILLFLLIGQKYLEPPTQSVLPALLFWGSALVIIFICWFQGKLVTDRYAYKDQEPQKIIIQPFPLVISIAAGLIAFLTFSHNTFTIENLIFWAISILFLFFAFLPAQNPKSIFASIRSRIKSFHFSGFQIYISPWFIACLSAFLLICFFRFYQLNKIPIEMFSDHAEKLLDVNDVLGGQFSIFFPRNTGREAFQMYLSAAIALIFKTGISFMTLKLGTAIMGVFTAVYMYFLGKETGNKWVGLFAFILCGIGYWPNVISRIGLRFTLYAAFTAPTLFYFIRGFRRKSWLDLVLAGIFTGIGLQGYSPFRVVPVLLIFGVIFYILHFHETDKRHFALIGLVITGVAALILFLPLFRYVLDQPESFAYRALTRAGTLERPLPGPAWQIFLTNLWKAMIMPFWNDGVIWVHSIPLRPALDVVTAALYLFGLIASLLRYVKQHDWRIPFLIFSVPFLMLPSIMSLAFPDENPCLNRTSGALVPIFLIAAFGLDTILENIKTQFHKTSGSIVACLIGGMLLFISILQNYNLVFVQFAENFKNNSLNTSQMGAVIRNFADVFGDPDSAYVVPYPYWVDTRLVGMNAGYATKDYATWPDKFSETTSNHKAKLFIVNPEDTAALESLRKLYPGSYERIYEGWTKDKNFILYFVPPVDNTPVILETPVP